MEILERNVALQTPSHFCFPATHLFLRTKKKTLCVLLLTYQRIEPNIVGKMEPEVAKQPLY